MQDDRRCMAISPYDKHAFAATYNMISGDESQPEKIWGMPWALAKNYGIFIVCRFIAFINTSFYSTSKIMVVFI